MGIELTSLVRGFGSIRMTEYKIASRAVLDEATGERFGVMRTASSLPYDGIESGGHDVVRSNIVRMCQHPCTRQSDDGQTSTDKRARRC